MQNYFNEENIEELKARLKWIQVLGADKKVYLAFDQDQPSNAEFNPVKAVTLIRADDQRHKLLDLGFQYKGLGKTLIIRDIYAFNWHMLERPDEDSPEIAKLILFCLAGTPSSDQNAVTKTFLLKFTDQPTEKSFGEDYVMIS